ncbi:GntR family transcriptional regulator [Saccharopolyspora tripterygii]
MVDHSITTGRDRFRSNRGRREQLPEAVASYVRDLIMSSQVKPGDFLRMEPIAEALGVSSTPVREGLLALSNEGFVKLIPRRGFVAASVSQQDVRDLFWTQAQFAGELAARAASKITPADLTRLESINEQFKEAVDNDAQNDITELGHAFHRLINRAAESRRLSLLLNSAVKQLPNRFYTSIEGHVTTTRDDHPKLIEALRFRDPELARTLTENHILDGADGVIRTMRARSSRVDSERAP